MMFVIIKSTSFYLGRKIPFMHDVLRTAIWTWLFL
jgi:hypothetical protein